jgi:HSP20 family molecular chaperone IbpA
VIPFPQGTALEHLDASFNDHVLTVRVPKPQPVPKGKQVAIKRLDASLADSA